MPARSSLLRIGMLLAAAAAFAAGCGDNMKSNTQESPERISERAVAQFAGGACSADYSGRDDSDQQVTVDLTDWDYATCEPADDPIPDAVVSKCAAEEKGATCVVTIEGGGQFNVKLVTNSNGCTVLSEMTLKTAPPQGSTLDKAFGDMSVGDGMNVSTGTTARDKDCS